ncbi:metal ABC transporter substrate-binding protein [Cyanobacterium aponinum AL20118]|uniref:Metal ABC transporter substrate-binding protein n=2 Tax=Cyanobacterium aponinum TaxID=379064 RepID=A0A844H013_9CHRO|nr:metal ABC transporter substrate-binding protein [Cyanobacterium aponinum]MTF39725.1 metal ABC transporter substrate-binding protein [Cyanobacterium aponinum 0216]PHV61960.1 metal ABC transporter substrate-binding protein [Cyanobacterium aponinum IPPAS B-1201]WPF89599.1 metal ABC transporter substrate-binding protein [Cyanobacterium aponinum AL20115]
MIRFSQSQNKLLIFTVLLGFALIGCNGSSEINQSSNPESEQINNTELNNEQGKKKVLTSFTILADMAKNVAGDKLIVESITRVGAEIHGYEPTPSDLVKAESADLVLYNGMNLERWMEQFLGNVQDVPSVVLTEGIEPIPIKEGAYINKPNPHAWMSPQNALIYVENIRQAFVELDPENADTYNSNAKIYSDKIKELDRILESDLARIPEDKRYLVSCEGAFSYLARDYDLKEIYLWPINAEQQFTPKQVQSVIEKVEANNIPTIFCETTVNDEGQKQVAKTTGARFGGNLYVDSLSSEEGAVPTYLDLLEYDIRTITNGLLAGVNN